MKKVLQKKANKKLLTQAGIGLLLVFTAACSQLSDSETDYPTRSPADIADDYLVGYAQMESYASRLFGIDTPPEKLVGENSPEKIAEWVELQKALFAELELIQPEVLPIADRRIYADVRGKIQAYLALRICRPELWPVNSFAGWHLNLSNTLSEALEDHHQRYQTMPDKPLLAAWADNLVAYLDQEQQNLNQGIAAGYTAYYRLALAAADQHDRLGGEQSDLLQVAEKLPSGLADAWRDIVEQRLGPRHRQHAVYLRNEYAPLARKNRAIASLPEGEACYQAMILHHTGAVFAPDDLFELADEMETVAKGELTALGEQLYGATDVLTALAALNASNPPTIDDPEQAKAYAQMVVDRMLESIKPFFHALPENKVTVQFYPEEQWGKGPAANYTPNFESEYTGTYFFDPTVNSGRVVRDIEAVAVHETAPGHHTQAVAAHYARAGAPEASHPILILGMNNAVIEGWAHYAERLVIEQGLFENADAAFRFWMGYGSLIKIDAGLHIGRLSQTEAEDLLLEINGLTREQMNSEALAPFFDRLAAIPAQAITYGLGAEFIYQLRERAKIEMGEDFDLRDFHRLILEEGSVPLWRLEEKIDAWIAQ